MEEVQFLRINLDRIIPDPDQPRKFFDAAALDELTVSVREKGVIQPIMVRPHGDQYMLVCGERRLRASLAVRTAMADRDTIPAVVRELSNDEALELQIIENLQRKDPHPMEEAVAFKSLMDKRDFSVLEIAGRVGKSDFYVRQRLKLNDLTPEWQQVFFQNTISLTDAMHLCVLPAKSQAALHKEEKESLKPGARYKLGSYTLENYKGDLHRAPFDLTNKMLDKKAGACDSCQYNTAVSLLFPEHAKSPRCTNVACFKKKCDVHLNLELKVALEDPTILLVSKDNTDNDLVKKLKADGHIVLRGYHDFTSVTEPSPPDFQELKEQNEYELEEEGKTIQEIEEEFAELTTRYEKEYQAYSKKIASGKFKKAFVVNGYGDTGKYMYIELHQKAQEKAAKAAIEKGIEAATDLDINMEIDRLVSREKRNKELDSEKVQKRVADELISSKDYYDNGEATLSANELIGLALYFAEHAGFDNSEWFRKRTKTSRSGDWNRIELYKALIANPDKFLPDIFRLIRRSLSHNLRVENDSPETKGDAAALRAIACDYIPGMVETFDAEQKLISDKRTSKVDKRVAELRKQLAPDAGKAAKKTKGGKVSAIAKGISSLINKEPE